MFEIKDARQTFVTVRNWGFSDGVDEAINSTEGFTNLLAGMKFYLEHGIEPNLVLDHAPDARVAWKGSQLHRSLRPGGWVKNTKPKTRGPQRVGSGLAI